MAMTMEQFVNNLKAIQSATGVEGMAELISFAAGKYCEGTTDAMDALISTAMLAGWRADFGAVLRELKIMEYGRIKVAEAPTEYKGVKITHRLKAKGKATDHQTGADLTGKDVKEALRFQMELAADVETVEEVIQIVRIAKEVDKQKKREEVKAKKETAEYWQDRIVKLVAEAGKHGFQIDAKLLGKLVEQAA